MRKAVFLVSALVPAFVLAGCGGADRHDYVERNEAILASLPVYPGAVRTHEVSTPYSNSEAQISGPSGYTTSVFYRVPSGGGGSVLRYYQSRLGRRGWRAHRIGGNPATVVDFTRGKALVAVNTTLPTYEVLIDYRGAARAG